MSRVTFFPCHSDPTPKTDVLEGAPSFAPSAKGGLLRSNAAHFLSFLSFPSFFRLPSNSPTTPKKITCHPEPAPLAGEGSQPKIPPTKLTFPSTNLSSRPQRPAFSLVRAARTPATQRRDPGNLSASWQTPRITAHGARATLLLLLSLLNLPLLNLPLSPPPAASNATPSPPKSSLAPFLTASSSPIISTPTKPRNFPSSIPSTASAITNSSSSTPASGTSSKTCATKKN